jgi:hypothetical protein
MWSILWSALAVASAAPAVDDPPKLPCCLTNPQYSGVCSVEPAADETCGEVLEYLNSPQSQGKSYCGNTSIRGGWTLAKCEPAPPPGS